VLCGLGTAASAQDTTPTPEAAPAAEDPEEEVVVAGARPHPNRAPKDPRVAGSVLRGERLLQPGTGPAEALREAPGVQVTQLGGLGAPATASLRGATAAQTPVYLGGVRLNDEIGGVANLADVPLFLVERVEVYRSHAPAGLELGIGGALVFEPKRPRNMELSLGAQAGSFGTRGGQGYAMFGNGHRGALAAFELSAADNDYEYVNDRGTLFEGGDDLSVRLRNADAQLGRFWFLADERLGRARVRFLAHHARREQGAPKLALTPTRAARVANERNLFAVTSHVPVDAWHGSLELATSATTSTTWLDDPLAELSLTSPALSTPGEHVEQRMRIEQRFAFGLVLGQQLAISAERLRRFAGRAGAAVQELSARRISMRPALTAELPLGSGWSAHATSALRCFDTSTAELDACSRALPEGRVGVMQRGDSYELFANGGRYQRLPTLSELYGAGLLVRGNPALDVEQGQSLEVGARWQSLRRSGTPWLWLEGSTFARWSSDLILYVRSAQGYLRPQNRASARTLGGEVSVGVAPVPGFEVSAQLSLLDARDTTPGRTLRNDVLPFVSPATASALATYTHRVSSAWLDDTTLGVRVTHQSSRFADPAGLGVIPAQTQTDLELAARLLERHLIARGRLANLFDVRRFDVVGFPLPGRSAFVSMETLW
jgi:iron complex outermembrane receptor protein